jgi:hypothetical protein
MAGMYMPGLRALTHGVEGATRARIAAWYTSSFTIGASLSFLFGRVGTLLGWRSAFDLGREAMTTIAERSHADILTYSPPPPCFRDDAAAVPLLATETPGTLSSPEFSAPLAS